MREGGISRLAIFSFFLLFLLLVVVIPSSLVPLSSFVFLLLTYLFQRLQNEVVLYPFFLILGLGCIRCEIDMIDVM